MIVVDIGGGTFIAPAAIEAVEWSSASECPSIHLAGGADIRARQWRSGPLRTPAETVEALLKHIVQRMNR